MSAFFPDDEVWIDALAHAADADPDNDHLQDLLALADEPEARAPLEGLLEARDSLRRAAMQDEVLAEVDAAPREEADRARVRAWALDAGLGARLRGSVDAAAPAPGAPLATATPRAPQRAWSRLLLVVAAAAAVCALILWPFLEDEDGAAAGAGADALLGAADASPLAFERAPDGGWRFGWELELPAGGYVELSFFEVARDGSRGARLFGPQRVRGRSAWTPPDDFPVFGVDRWQWELVAFNGLNGREGTYVLDSAAPEGERR